MSLTTYLAAGGLLAVAVVYGLWTWDSRTKSAQIEAATAIIDVQQGQIAQAKLANETNMATLTQIKADLARQASVTAKFETLARDRGFALSKALKRINDAPKSDDGDLAPVLRRELSGLRPDGDGKPAPDGVDKDPAGSPANPVSPNLPGTTEAPGS
jgi:hypothetical protein